MMNLIIPIIALPVILLISTLVSFKMNYEKGYWFFEFFHFSGSFFLAMLFLNFVSSASLILLAVIATGVFWEILEFIVSLNTRLKTLLRMDKLTLKDTTLDLLLDTLGGVVFLITIHLY